ncbi:MAG TPA: homoserine kinase [Dokdonella sp.]|uniref:homoserine kinase n=1 Tax=Dokdonella sp. TaxID=2291710 RepID=UPI002B6BA43F|nr:homoserine kinase [Xanthomonadales bacterium]MBL0223017.1 homoserine kinase [Xanthomonadales bacterium]HQV71376.1 homoserine kinase [Dokdonella sp.]HQW75318.1 homoserine kinase [Dokdonella sp.]
MSATAHAPASIGNVAVGFDILGQSIAGIGDQATVRRIDEALVRIDAIRGCVRDLPLEPMQNTAGRALLAMREALDLPFGFAIELEKGIALGSGMGGSAASCVAALVAANALLEEPLSAAQLYPFALDGEAVSSGSRHGDNVGPMLLGGLVLAAHGRLLRIEVPEVWHSVVVHPDAVLETRRARQVLQGTFALTDFVAQSANLSLVLSGCQRGDAELVRAGLADVLVEPRRAPLIRGFHAVKDAALAHDAMGASISGAGPSVFAWFETRSRAAAAAAAMVAAFEQAGQAASAFLSPINGPAAALVR